MKIVNIVWQENGRVWGGTIICLTNGRMVEFLETVIIFAILFHAVIYWKMLTSTSRNSGYFFLWCSGIND